MTNGGIMECAVCDGKAILHREETVLTYRKEEFPLMSHFYQCEKCGYEFTTDELDGLDLGQVHNQYRERHKIPFPEQLKNIREKYRFAAKKMSEILGFGQNQYALYEKGEVPNLSNGRLLSSILDPGTFVDLLKRIDIPIKQKQIEHLESLSSSDEDWTLIKLYDLSIFDSSTPSSNTGYVISNVDKIIQVITYFAKEVRPMKTKLNKLLYYADFLNYKNYGTGITGIEYRAIQMGPVPASYDMYYSVLLFNDLMNEEYIDFGNGFKGEILIPNGDFEADVFDENELKSLELVKDTFKDMKTDEIIEFSHNEKGWKENESEKRIIDYQKYAFDLTI